MISRYLAASAAFLLTAAELPGVAAAQPVLAHATSDPLAQMQMEAKAKAADLRQAWLASGHAQSPAVVTPAITAGKLITTQLNVGDPPAAPIVSISYSTGAAGLCSINMSFSSATSAQSLSVYYSTPYKAPPQTQGTVKIQQVGWAFGTGAFNPYSAAGNWHLTAASISDCAGNYATYDSAHLAPLFNTLKLKLINNRKPDTAAPVVTAGTILTPKVSLSSASPTFRAQLAVSDNVSGLSYILITVCPPSGSGGSCWVSNTHPPMPLRSGNAKSYTYIGSAITGQWTIQQFGVCDIASNCIYDTNSADIVALFGTNTFKVTN